MKSTRRLHTGFTIVELLVAVTVASLLLYAVWDMFAIATRAFVHQEGKSQALTSAVLAYDIIARDLRGQFYFGVPHDEVADTLPVSITDTNAGEWGTSIAFTRFDKFDYDGSHYPQVLESDVTLRLEPSGSPDYGYLRSSRGVHHTIKLADLRFKLEQTPGADGKPRFFVALKIKGYGEQERDHNLLVGLLALDAYTLRTLEPYWVEEPSLVQGDVPPAT